MTPDVPELPESVTVPVVQVIGPLTLALAPGVVIFCDTATEAVDVHPLTGFVTVKVYVPVPTSTEEVVSLPGDQWYDAYE